MKNFRGFPAFFSPSFHGFSWARRNLEKSGSCFVLHEFFLELFLFFCFTRIEDFWQRPQEKPNSWYSFVGYFWLGKGIEINQFIAGFGTTKTKTFGGRAVPAHPSPDPWGEFKQQNWILEIQEKIILHFFPLFPSIQIEKKWIKGNFPNGLFGFFQLCCTSGCSNCLKLDFGRIKKSKFPRCLPSSSRKNPWEWPGGIPRAGMAENRKEMYLTRGVQTTDVV